MSVLRRLKKIIRSNVSSFIENHKNSPEKDYTYKSFSDYQYTSSQDFESAINSSNTKESQYYANLEISNGATFEEIKQAYRSLLKKYHPDLHNSSPDDRACAEKITQKLNEAFNYFEDKFNKGDLK